MIVRARVSKIQPSSTTEAVYLERVEDLDRVNAMLRLHDNLGEAFTTQDGLVHLDVSLATPREIMAMHDILHGPSGGNLAYKHECAICPSMTDYGDVITEEVYTIVVSPKEPVCTVGCPYCYAKPRPLSEPLKLGRDAGRRVGEYAGAIAAEIWSAKPNATINIIPWGGSSDPSTISTLDEYLAGFAEALSQRLQQLKFDTYAELYINLSTSARSVDAIMRQIEALVRARSAIKLPVYTDSAIAVNLSVPSDAEYAKRYHITTTYAVDTIFSLPRRIDDVIIIPTFIMNWFESSKMIADIIAIHKYLSENPDSMPFILAPYGDAIELHRYFGYRSMSEVRRDLRAVVYRLLHYIPNIMVDACSYNAMFRGIDTPRAYAGRWIFVQYSTATGDITHKVHDGSWCPRGAYTGRGCIYPPRRRQQQRTSSQSSQ